MKLGVILQQLNERHDGAETVMALVDECIVSFEVQGFSTQLLQLDKKLVFDPLEHFRMYGNVFTSPKIKPCKV